jgi:hypothetical protein
LAEIACGDFSGHHFVDRGQKAWFLPAASAETLTGDFSGHHFVDRGQKAWFLPAASAKPRVVVSAQKQGTEHSAEFEGVSTRG